MRRKNKAPMSCPVFSERENLRAASNRERAERTPRKILMRGASVYGWSYGGYAGYRARSTWMWVPK